MIPGQINAKEILPEYHEYTGKRKANNNILCILSPILLANYNKTVMIMRVTTHTVATVADYHWIYSVLVPCYTDTETTVKAY